MYENLTNKKQIAIAKFSPNGSLDHFTLDTTESLIQSSPEINKSFKSGYLSEENSFDKVFGDSGESFFYVAKCIDSNSHEIIISEFGIGDYKDGVINKINVFYYQRNGNTSPPLKSFRNLDRYLEQGYGIIESYVPSSLGELLLRPNSIPFSESDSTLSACAINRFSLLGRLDGEIQSINIERLLSLIPNFSTAISSIKSSLFLKCRILFSKVMSCEELIIKKNQAPEEMTEGSLYFDKDDNKLKFFDGTNIKIIKTE